MIHSWLAREEYWANTAKFKNSLKIKLLMTKISNLYSKAYFKAYIVDVKKE